MADKQHATLTGSQLHEVKGADDAAADTWLKAAGDGTAGFEALPTHSLKVESIVTLTATTAQALSTAGTDTSIVYEGGAWTTTDGMFSISSAGSVRVNQDGLYAIRSEAQAGVDTLDASATLAFSSFVDGVQSGNTSLVTVKGDTVDDRTSVRTTSIAYLTADSIITFRMGLFDITSGSAGLYPTTISNLSGWSDAAAAKLSVSKIGIDQ